MNRREALSRMGALMAFGSIGFKASGETTAPITAVEAGLNPGQSFTIAHITDTHITDAYNSEKWVSECFHKIQSHPAKPQLILHTGDIILDSLRTDRKKAEHYWKIWRNVVKRESSLPVKYAIGNHDVLGGKLPVDHAVTKDPMFGKALVKEKLGLERLYNSFDFGGWHFIMLDSIYPFVEENSHFWFAKLGDEQLEWLKNDLAAVPADKPVVVGSHVPIAQASILLHQKPSEDGTYTIGPRNIMTDARQIIDLFRKHPNVKLCFSGHTHQRDFVKLENATYINAGSVCGAQWRVEGQNPEKPGFSIVTLQPDGNFDYNYENYGWKWA